MKKILIFFLLLYPVVLIAQPAVGDGVILAYSGAITTPWTLTGDKLCGTLTVSSGTFTIEAGSVLRFGTGNNLTVSSTAVLYAEGTSAQPITFTASGTTWGHLQFSSSQLSTLNNCIIENGVAVDGGGIQCTTPFLSLKNSIIRFNRATGRGGGIYISANIPTISGCVITNNQATGTIGGGGMFFSGATTATKIENCIITNNSTTNSSATINGGGGVYLSNPGSIKFYNCVFASNTSNTTGDDVFFRNGINAQFFNTVLWNCDSPIGYYPTAPIATSFNFSAIQGNSSSYTSCITLSGNNSDPNGPNFINPASGNYNISLISPCLNAGSATGAPEKDILENGRILAPDIGAYEVQYARWKTDAVDDSWSNTSNWEGNPSTAPLINIPAGATMYPNPAYTSSAEDVTIASGVSLVLEPGAQVTFNSLTNNGIITLKSDATGMFSLMLGSYDGSGIVNTELYLTGGTAGGNKWHYLATPAGMGKGVLTAINPYNLLRYDDSRISESETKLDGWQWHDGWDGTSTNPLDAFGTLDVKRGYNFYHTADATADFTSNSLVTEMGLIPLQYSGVDFDDNLYGWNLLGNSLTCGINWDYALPDGRVAVYYTKDDKMTAYVDGTSVNGGGPYIPPLQGFFVKAQIQDQNVDFLGSSVHTVQQFNKGTSETKKGTSETKPIVRLIIEQGDKNDETVIRLFDEATVGFDAKFDASKWASGSGYPQLSTYFSNEDFSINTLPFPETQVDIPVSITIPSNGNYVIKNTLIDGLDGYNIFLKDLQESQTVDLRSIPEYSFAATAGTFKNRFVISIVNITTGTEIIPVSDDSFNIYAFNEVVNINPMSDEWNGLEGSVRILDLTGKVIAENRNVEFWNNTVIQIPVSQNNGIYFVEITSGVKRFVGKVAIR